MLLAGLGACSEDEELVDGRFTQAEWAKVQTLSPLPDVPEDTTNRYADDPAAAALGQRLFNEKGYSGPLFVGDDGTNGGLGAVGESGKVACASCHEGPWMIDLRSNPNNASLGADWIPRNANTLVNVAFYEPWFENDGISDSLWSDVLVDPEFHLAINGSRLKLAHVMWDKYREEYNAVFDPDLDPALDPAAPDAARFPEDGRPGDDRWESMAPADQEIVTVIYVNFAKAVGAYMRLLVSREAPFDRYVAGDRSAIGEEAKRGLQLFIGKAGCVACHEGPHFSDDDFHVNGLRAEGPHIIPEETGRYAIIERMLANPFNSDGPYSDDRSTGRLDGLALTEEARGQWRTKGLRSVAETAPYMHTGQFEALRDVVSFYNDGGHESGFVGVKSDKIVPLNLTEQEIDDLVAFLETLTGEEVPAALREDTSAK
ncbi:MAG TPA: cytochrome c peroxidase [Candidatus Nanopelagicales bacterium]|nr:cytochrome c peroxidase [Candidatus Nanopelagicales bacterium]